MEPKEIKNKLTAMHLYDCKNENVVISEAFIMDKRILKPVMFVNAQSIVVDASVISTKGTFAAKHDVAKSVIQDVR
ncbi:MAG: hypothetical protein HUK15_04415 [Bacteroidales bacterium]|nr:hypothetical protein [Bacteroidales bacterium]